MIPVVTMEIFWIAINYNEKADQQESGAASPVIVVFVDSSDSSRRHLWSLRLVHRRLQHYAHKALVSHATCAPTPMRIYLRELRIVSVFALNCMFVCRETLDSRPHLCKTLQQQQQQRQQRQRQQQQQRKYSTRCDKGRQLARKHTRTHDTISTLFKQPDCATSASPVQLESFLD